MHFSRNFLRLGNTHDFFLITIQGFVHHLILRENRNIHSDV